MKKKELKEIKNKEVKELAKMVEERKLKLRKFLIDLKVGSEKNVKRGAIIRDEIAKILTLIREKEIIESLKDEKDKEDKK